MSGFNRITPGPNMVMPEARIIGDAVGISTEVAKFGTKSFKCWNGTGNSSTYLQVSPSPTASWTQAATTGKVNKEFTAEFWIYMTAAPTTTVNIWQRLGFSTEWRFLMQANRIPQLRYRYYNPYPGTFTERVISASVLALNTWHHMAFSYNENTTYFFVNGSLVGSFTETQGFYESGSSNSGWAIGEGAQSGMRYYMDEVRVSDVCRYTASFTPQDKPFDYDNRTIALFHFEDQTGVAELASDYSPRTAKNMTAVGDARIYTGFSPFGDGSAIVFNGTDDYIQTATSDDFNVAGGNWTVEGWLRWNGGVKDHGIFSYYEDLGGGSVAGINFRYTAGSLSPYFRAVIRNGTSSVALNSEVITIATGTWYHFALLRDGTDLKMYLNGSLLATTTIFISVQKPPTAPLVFGLSQTVSNSSLSGYLSELRFSDIARYSGSSYTVPSARFKNDHNTLLLIHGTGTQNSTLLPDDVL